MGSIRIVVQSDMMVVVPAPGSHANWSFFHIAYTRSHSRSILTAPILAIWGTIAIGIHVGHTASWQHHTDSHLHNPTCHHCCCQHPGHHNPQKWGQVLLGLLGQISSGAAAICNGSHICLLSSQCHTRAAIVTCSKRCMNLNTSSGRNRKASFPTH